MSQPLFHSSQTQHMGSPISWEGWARLGSVRPEPMIFQQE